METRLRVWERLASDLKPRHLDGGLANEIRLEQLPGALEQILEGQVRGRTIVAMQRE